MKFRILDEAILFPTIRKFPIVTCIYFNNEESYRLAGENHLVSVDNLASLEEVREDIKRISEVLFSVSPPVQQELIKMGVLKFLLKADTALCEEFEVEREQ